MGSSKKQTVGYKYYLGMHLIMCHGPIDAIKRLTVDRRVAWEGDSTGGPITVAAEGLFGGEEREGGISGRVDVEMGEASQVANDYLVAQLTEGLVPAFRRVVGLVLRHCYLGMNPYLKTWGARGQRIHVRQHGIEQWYDAKAAIASAGATAAPIEVAEDFSEGMAPYSVESGSDDSFSVSGSPYGSAMTTEGTSGGIISRGLDQIGGLLSVRVKFQVEEPGTDDFGTMDLWDEFGYVFTFDPMRQNTFDAAQRPGIQISEAGVPAGDEIFIGTEAVDVGAWYQFEAVYSDEDSGYNCTITNIVTSVVWGTAFVPCAPRPRARQLIFRKEVSGGSDGVMRFADVELSISPDAPEVLDMNPAHIIRECLTDPDWGMGYSEADIDDVSFTAAADTMYDEGMGISILWDRQMPLKDFIDQIVKHIAASLYVDRTTGKFVLKLIRADYDVETILHLDETNISKVESASRPTSGELVNSITAVYWSTQTGENASVTVQDQALIQMQGAVVNTTLQYPGFTSASITARAALRALSSMSVPLLSCVVYADRSASSLNIGDVFLMDWPDLEIVGVVMRVTGMALGDGKNNAVKLNAVEDIFSFPDTATTGVEPIPGPGVGDPSAAAKVATRRVVLEVPYYEAAQQLGQSSVDSTLAAGNDVGYVALACSRPSIETVAVLQTDAGGGFSDAATFDFCPSATLSAPVDRLVELLPIQGGVDLDLVVIGSWAALTSSAGTEFVRVDSVSDTEVGVGRSVHDTVPLEHPLGAVLLFLDFDNGVDPTEYAEGESIDMRVLTVSGSGRLPEGSAPIDTVVLAGRAFRPYPPGNFQINGEYYPTDALNTIDVTWAHRDRAQQTGGVIIDFLDGDVGPEPGVTYTVRVLIDAVEVELETGITGTSHSFVPATAGEATVQVWAVRDGLESLYRQEAIFAYINSRRRITDAGDVRITDASDTRISE